MNGILDLLTGIELHTCNKWWGGTTYGMYASFLSPETEYTKCTTQDLMTYQIMHRGEWMDYNGYILGDCSHFLLNLKNKVHTHTAMTRSFAKTTKIIQKPSDFESFL